MKIEESLTKENFWNEVEQKYPNAFKIFADWIDEYKKEIEWDYLFKPKTALNTIFYTKFHDIPHAMQLGIWIKFLNQNSNSQNPNIFFDIRESIIEWMENYENQDSM